MGAAEIFSPHHKLGRLFQRLNEMVEQRGIGEHAMKSRYYASV